MAVQESYEPSYKELARSGELSKRVKEVWDMMRRCELCPRLCRVNRLENKTGFCRSGQKVKVSSFNPHFGEEPVLVGYGGSGTIFFTNCTLCCIFCQNYPISQMGNGREYSIDELANMFLRLQRMGCHNINFVTPTHFLPHILKALERAIPNGFNLPLVYNTSGYERVEILEMLEGIVDIYLPDIKYSSNEMAHRYSGVDNYVEHNRAALKEMFRQVGLLRCDERDVAQRGIIVRHLVLPEDISGSEEAIKFLARELSPNLHLALMSQYFPAYKAPETPPLDRRIDKSHYMQLAKLVKKIGFQGWIQPI